MMDKSRAFLRTLGLPGGDLHALPTSEATFPGGAQFGVEIPTVNTFAAAKALLREHRALLDEIALYLLQKETITGEEFMHILNAQ